MEIQKVFSDYYDTERMYSVLMSEDELRLFALRDYEGLTPEFAEQLRKERSDLAKELLKTRKKISQWHEANKIGDFDPKIHHDSLYYDLSKSKVRDDLRYKRYKALSGIRSDARFERDIAREAQERSIKRAKGEQELAAQEAELAAKRAKREEFYAGLEASRRQRQLGNRVKNFVKEHWKAGTALGAGLGLGYLALKDRNQ